MNRREESAWMIEEWDSHWGGWRKMFATWESHEPARFATKALAQDCMETVKARRPWAQFRVVDK